MNPEFRTRFDRFICRLKAVRSGGAGGAVAPPEIFKAKKIKKYTQILDFLIVVSVNQNTMQLK